MIRGYIDILRFSVSPDVPVDYSQVVLLYGLECVAGDAGTPKRGVGVAGSVHTAENIYSGALPLGYGGSGF